MMKLVVVSSDGARLKLAGTVKRKHAQDTMLGTPRLRPDTGHWVEQLHNQFEAAHENKRRYRSARTPLTQKMESQNVLLRGRLAALWREVRAEVAAGTTTSALYTQYGLTLDGSAPSLSGRETPITVATEVLKGHADAQAHPDFPRLDASRVQEALYNAQNTLHALVAIDDATVKVQQTLRPLRNEIRLAMRSVVSEVRSTLVHESPEHQRNVLRDYGFTFRAVDANGKVLPQEGDPSQTPAALEDKSLNADDATDHVTDTPDEADAGE